MRCVGTRIGEGFDLAGRIATALAAAHAHGILYRDLEPDAMVLTDEGAVELPPGPEPGEAAIPASDVYSFGLLLEELLAGPHRADRDLATLIRQMKSPVPAERPTAAEVGDRLRWIRDKPQMRRRAAFALFRAAIRNRRQSRV